MPLCEKCAAVDFRALLLACLKQCKLRQVAYGPDGDGISAYNPEDLPWCRHHDDIFHVRESSGGCVLCRVIIQAFDDRDVEDPERARGLPIVFGVGAHGNIQIFYGSEGEKIELCGIDVSMSQADVDNVMTMCGLHEDDQPPIFRVIETDPSSSGSFAIASRWLRNCLENHDSCNETRLALPKRPPKRLIYVGTEDRDPRLIETSSEHSDEKIEWVCLSYCWGPGTQSAVKLTSSTMPMLKDGFPMESLDATIRDAIKVTRALGIPHLWVDALCIMQDPQVNEWNKEALRMSEIYGGAVATLVIADSQSVKNGFLTPRELEYVPWSAFRHDRTKIPPRVQQTARVYLSREWDTARDNIGGPWASRGWTMQEGLLPNRLLYYTSSQIVWQCCEEHRFERGVTKSLQDVVDRTIRSFEDLDYGSSWFWNLGIFMRFKLFPSYLPDNQDTVAALPEKPDTFRLWYQLVQEFTPREFTDIRDRLVAISGLAQMFGDMIQCQDYAAGLWKPDLVRGLMWQTQPSKLIPPAHFGNQDAITEFPSWSWANTGYHSVVYDSNDEDRELLTRVDAVHVDLVDPNLRYGSIKSGAYITVTGPIKRLQRLYIEGWNSPDTQLTELERHVSATIESETPQNTTIDPRFCSPLGGHFAVVQMLEGQGHHLLALEHTGETVNGVGVYRRVGTHVLHYVDMNSAASPSLLAKLVEFQNSLSAQLGPRLHGGRKVKGANKVVEELWREPWETGTVTII